MSSIPNTAPTSAAVSYVAGTWVKYPVARALSPIDFPVWISRELPCGGGARVYTRFRSPADATAFLQRQVAWDKRFHFYELVPSKQSSPVYLYFDADRYCNPVEFADFKDATVDMAKELLHFFEVFLSTTFATPITLTPKINCNLASSSRATKLSVHGVIFIPFPSAEVVHALIARANKAIVADPTTSNLLRFTKDGAMCGVLDEGVYTDARNWRMLYSDKAGDPTCPRLERILKSSRVLDEHFIRVYPELRRQEIAVPREAFDTLVFEAPRRHAPAAAAPAREVATSVASTSSVPPVIEAIVRTHMKVADDVTISVPDQRSAGDVAIYRLDPRIINGLTCVFKAKHANPEGKPGIVVAPHKNNRSIIEHRLRDGKVFIRCHCNLSSGRGMEFDVPREEYTEAITHIESDSDGFNCGPTLHDCRDCIKWDEDYSELGMRDYNMDSPILVICAGMGAGECLFGWRQHINIGALTCTRIVSP